MIEVEELTLENYEIVAEWLSNPEINRWLASGWRGKHFNTKTIVVVAMNEKNKLFLVRYNGVACGLVALSMIDQIDKTANLWYLLGDNKLEGKGIITSAIKLVVRIAFNELRLRSLSASFMDLNEGSRRLLEKNNFREVGKLRYGFLFEGTFVDRIVFDLIPEDLN